MDIYPTNTVARYITRLPKALEFDDSWEVGISEIVYPRTWYNVFAGQCYGFIANDERITTSRLTVPEGYYESVPEMLGAIAVKMFDTKRASLQLVTRGGKSEKDYSYDDDKHHHDDDDDDDDDDANTSFVVDIDNSHDDSDSNTMVFRNVDGAEFGVVHRTQKVFIRLPANVNLQLSETFAQTLGFEKCKFIGGKEYVSTFAADVNRSVATIFVYCNVVRESIVGNTTAPLLRTLNIEGRYGDVIQKIYHTPIYVPLQRSYFDSIEINIRDDTGRLVPFESGKAIVTLHFRRSTNPYFLPFSRASSKRRRIV